MQLNQRMVAYKHEEFSKCQNQNVTVSMKQCLNVTKSERGSLSVIQFQRDMFYTWQKIHSTKSQRDNTFNLTS